jgi:hypothetical protein
MHVIQTYRTYKTREIQTKFLVGKPEEPLGRPARRWENNGP